MQVGFETSSYCNQKCKFCVQDKFRMKNRIMSTEKFKKILDAIAKVTKIECLNFAGMGEPIIELLKKIQQRIDND